MENNELYTQFDSVFFEKTRLSIITILYKEEKASYNRLKAVLQQSDGAVYSHIQKLAVTGYISESREIVENNLHTFYALTEEGKRIFNDYIRFLENIVQSDGRTKKT